MMKCINIFFTTVLLLVIVWTGLSENAYGNTVCYIYDNDLQSAKNFESLLETNGISTELTELGNISTTDFSIYKAIIVGYDTGFLSNWGDPAAITAIEESGLPIIGNGEGGYSFFGKLGLDIGYPNGQHETLGRSTGLYVVDPEHPIYNVPNNIYIGSDRILDLYTRSNSVQIFMRTTPSDVTILSRQMNWQVGDQINHLVVLQRNMYMFWGFTASPDMMTQTGKDLYVNFVSYFLAEKSKLNILVDASRDGGVWWFGQPEYQGKPLAKYLKSQGHIVTELSNSTGITYSMLKQYDIVIRANEYTAYSGSEIEAYHQFVEDGGGLLLLGGCVRPGERDSLALSFGIRFEGITRGENRIDVFREHPITRGVSSLVYGVGSGITGIPRSAELLGFVSENTYLDLNNNGTKDTGEPTGIPVLGMSTLGNGKIVFCGDTNTWLWVPQPLVDNTIDWLATPLDAPVFPVAPEIPSEAHINVPMDYPTIQAAINAASSGDMVLVADGIHRGTGNVNLDFHGKRITLKSENGPNNCVINCENSARGFHFHSGEDSGSIVDGFTIVYGNAEYGGGIFCEAGSSPSIIDIIGNKEMLSIAHNSCTCGIYSVS